MKKILIILVCIFSISSLHAINSYLDIKSNAVTFDLSATNLTPHTRSWSGQTRPSNVSGGGYYDSDMIGDIGITDNTGTSYGVLVRLQVLNNGRFLTPDDFSAFREFGVEIIPRRFTSSTNTTNIDYNISYYMDEACTVPYYNSAFSSTTYTIVSNTSSTVYFKMQVNCSAVSYAKSAWCDLVMIMDGDFKEDSLTVSDNYYGTILVGFYPLDANGDMIEGEEWEIYTLNLAGYYGTEQPDYYKVYSFFIFDNENANSIDLTNVNNWQEYLTVANIQFSTFSSTSSSRAARGVDYRIVISSSADYLLSTDKFKFRLIGGSSTETLRNTCEYIVQVIPTPTTYSSYTESSITSGNYIQLADTTSSQYNSSYSSMTSSAINGTEDVSLRKIQVPLISSGYNAQSNGSFYYFSYSADIGILLTGFEGTDNRTALQSGLYTSTIFITVISEL